MLNWIKSLGAGSAAARENAKARAQQHKAAGDGALRQGDFPEAAAAYRLALGLVAGDIDLQCNLGFALMEAGDLAAAREALHAALALDADSPDALYMLGKILRMTGDDAAAYRHLAQVLTIDPCFVAAYQELLAGYLAHGDVAAARHLLERAVTALPDVAEFHFHLANLHSHAGSSGAMPTKAWLDGSAASADVPTRQTAIHHFQRAIELAPAYFEAHNNLGNLLEADGQHHAAAASFVAATALRPTQAEAFVNLGGALMSCGDLDAAMTALRMAIRLNPALLSARSSLLFAASQSSSVSPEAYRQEADLFGVLAAAGLTACTDTCDRQARPMLPLRVGLVSGDLGMHPVGYFLENIVSHLDPAKVVLHAYATTVGEDALTCRIKPGFAVWRNIAGMNDSDAARQISADGIDILIDLAGHTAHNRLPLFALKPAPVQASWLGYWASTGVAQIDYLLADPVSIPEAEDGPFNETVWRLPHTRLCFSPPADAPAVAAAPVLKNGFITFGCFQRTSKISTETLRLWQQILRDMPRARLRVQSKQLRHQGERDAFLARLMAAGLDCDRVILVGPMPRADYLAAHGEVDIILDTAPFPGGTTTCEALWMGVPTLTLAGGSMLSRQGASLLQCAELSEWVARDAADYVMRAQRLAADLPALTATRASLREQVRASPLCDARRFARDLEAALAGMWKNRSGKRS